MKIVDREEMLLLPVGTVFQECTNCQPCGELLIKEEMIGNNDFCTTTLTGSDVLMPTFPVNLSTPISFDFTYRDALTADDNYLIYEEADIASLFEKINSFKKPQITG